jgi:hypothetical protein
VRCASSCILDVASGELSSECSGGACADSGL